MRAWLGRVAVAALLSCGGRAADGAVELAPPTSPDGVAGRGTGLNDPAPGGIGRAGSGGAGGRPSGFGNPSARPIPESPPGVDSPPSVVGDRPCLSQAFGVLEIRRREELEALRGCSSIEGDVVIYPFDSAVDLTPLAALTRVGGTLTLGDPGSEPPLPSFTSLAGLESLRSVGGLMLRGVTARSLDPLSGLVELTTSTGIMPLSGFVVIEHCPLLENLRGLDNLEGLRGFVARRNVDLVSLVGLRVPAELQRLEILDSPVVDISPLRALNRVEYELFFMRTLLRDASALEQLSHVDQLQFVDNISLTDLTGVAALTTANHLVISENANLEVLPEFPLLSALETLTIQSNGALREVRGMPALRSVYNVVITANPLLTRVAAMATLERANDIYVDDNPLLVELELGSLTQVAGVLRVAHNPSLDASALPRPPGATIVIGGNRGDVLGLDPCPWSGNAYCEAPPADDLCAPNSDSDCLGDVFP